MTTFALDVRPTDALIVIDVQNDFCPGGALAVPDGDAVVPGIVDLAEQFAQVFLTQDAHPPGHASFASTHQRDPFTTVMLPYGEQTLWPDHCVQGSKGFEFHKDLSGPYFGGTGVVERATAIVRKGMNPLVDSYSAFYENDRTSSTGLAGMLRERGVQRVVLVGLAYDFCVGYSALDAIREGFEVVVVKPLTRSIGMPLDNQTTTETHMDAALLNAGVTVIQESRIPKPKA